MTNEEATAATVPLLSAAAVGDGLLALVLARNLQRDGRRCVLHHTQLRALRAWVPGLEIEPLPDATARVELFAGKGPLFVGDPALVPPGHGAGPRQLVFTSWRTV